ncbi:hypothetical protein C2845_PM07G27520 [Panicum miliaceum]|uniref:Uncharacterized protein n=1 Tax=Panicum miliaceum TaxID=4540 RepID=A0A3L6SHU7_PANMI|nr:hypothetical protein C2845_PM07G27520 [Panicum miliaceum]
MAGQPQRLLCILPAEPPEDPGGSPPHSSGAASGRRGPAAVVRGGPARFRAGRRGAPSPARAGARGPPSPSLSHALLAVAGMAQAPSPAAAPQAAPPTPVTPLPASRPRRRSRPPSPPLRRPPPTPPVPLHRPRPELPVAPAPELRRGMELCSRPRRQPVRVHDGAPPPPARLSRQPRLPALAARPSAGPLLRRASSPACWSSAVGPEDGVADALDSAKSSGIPPARYACGRG